MFRWILIIIPLLLPCSVGHAQTPPTPANCSSGQPVTLMKPGTPPTPSNLSVCGTVEMVGAAKPPTVYRGIPYATAGRWQNPVPIANPATATVFAATQFGPACPQPGQPSLPQSEDCLYLNIWVPNGATSSSNLPVMVFFYGGAFVSGAGSLPLYDGASLAASGNVIVVTFNYRLGALGFIYAPSLTFGVSQSNPQGNNAQFGGNFGLYDQQSALGWVQLNIGGFGGNANNVTIFGESAGAMSIGLHLLSIPTSNGTVNGTTTYSLFQKAIMESNPMGLPYSTIPNATAFFDALCSAMNQDASCWESATSLAAFASTATLDQVMYAQQQYITGGGQLARMATGGMSSYLPFAPIIDNSYITGQPMSGYAPTMSPLPVLVGMNKNEGAAFAGLGFQSEPALMTPDAFGTILSYAYPKFGNKITTFSTTSNNVTTTPYNASVQSMLAPIYYDINCSQQAGTSTVCNTQAAANACVPNIDPVTCYGQLGTDKITPTNCTKNSGVTTCTFPSASATNGCLPPNNAATTVCTPKITVCIPNFSTNTSTCTFNASDCTPVSQTCNVPGNGAPVAFANIVTDDIFTCGNMKGAGSMLKAAKQPAIYVYQFTEAPLFDIFPGLPSCSAESGNVCHASELPYVFNTLGNYVYNVPPANAALATAIGTAWTNFATYGNPNGSGTANTPWPSYTSSAANVNVLNASGNTVTTSLATTANCTALWNTIPPLSTN